MKPRPLDQVWDAIRRQAGGFPLRGPSVISIRAPRARRPNPVQNIQIAEFANPDLACDRLREKPTQDTQRRKLRRR